MMSVHRNRRDHYIPQGYLRGFIAPDNRLAERPLWAFDIPHQKWSEKSTREIAYRYGLYDYSEECPPEITVDSAFVELEQTFPKVREEIVAGGFTNWKTHKDFLIRFMDMLRVRSLLYFDEMLEAYSATQILEIENVLDTRPDLSDPNRSVTTVKYKERTFKSRDEKQRLLKNLTLTEMRRALEAPAPWLSSVNWVLRYTSDSHNPCVCSEQPLLLHGSETSSSAALSNPDTFIFFPLSWNACMVGCPVPIDKDTDEFHPVDLGQIRKIYREAATLFVVSPHRITL
jgi:hypothetical protein